jgi:hypothetical protein
LSVQTPDWSRLHRLFFGVTRRGKNGSKGRARIAISSRFRRREARSRRRRATTRSSRRSTRVQRDVRDAGADLGRPPHAHQA